MSSTYSFINEAWGIVDNNESQHQQPPLFNIIKQEQDDIMNIYLNSDTNSNSNKKKKSTNERNLAMSSKPAITPLNVNNVDTKKCYDFDNIDGFANEPLLKQAYAYDNFYIQNNVRDTVEHEDCDVPAAPVKEEIYKDIILERYANLDTSANTSVNTNINTSNSNTVDKSKTNKSQNKEYMDLTLYIVSGAFLILMMEQILHLGFLMRNS